MKKLCLAVFVLIFALGIVGCKDGKDDDAAAVPTCKEVCAKKIEIQKQGASEAELKDWEQEGAQAQKECEAECPEYCDDECKTCVMAAKDKDGLKACKKAAKKRRKAKKKADEGKK